MSMGISWDKSSPTNTTDETEHFCTREEPTKGLLTTDITEYFR